MPMLHAHEHIAVLGDVPSLVVETQGDVAPDGRGTVLLLHGLGASKELQRKEAYSLAAQGCRAVILDAVGHGERRYPDFDSRFSPERAERSFGEVIQQSSNELPGVIQGLKQRGWMSGGLG